MAELRRQKGYAVALVVAGAAILGMYLAPEVRAHEALPSLTAQTLFTRAQTAENHDAFGETLRYQNRVIPASVNLAAFFNVPWPNANVAMINLYQNSAAQWRIEELSATGQVVGVVARANHALVTYRADNNQREVSTLADSNREAGEMWPIPTGHWLSDWRARVRTAEMADVPVYQVTLIPRRPGTLVGRVTYWFQGRYFIPMGVEVTDRAGQDVLGAQAVVFTQGAPGSSAKAPRVGKEVSYRPSEAAMHMVALMASGGPINRPPKAPKTLGPLSLDQYKAMDSTSIAIYGTGPRRVIAIESSRTAYQKIIKGQKVHELLLPIDRSHRFYGTTDALVSVVSFRNGTHQVILVGSWPKGQLMRWAQTAWQ